MSVEGFFYIDKKGREVLYIPFVSVIVGHRKEPSVILEPRKLKRRQADWKAGRTSIVGKVYCFEIPKEDIGAITGLCFSGKIAEAKGYCVDVFDQIANRVYGIDSSYRGCKKCQ